MPLVPVHGHDELRTRFREMVARNTLPATILIQGLPGIGKQRLALWLGQYLLCQDETARENPCGRCAQCRLSVELRHPDLLWVFPRPRPKDTDPDLDDLRADYQEAAAERADQHGLYEAPSGSDGIFVATIRMIVRQAVLSPSLANRKVFVVGDADRMVSQEGSEQAANAFLKLLEEPPADTTIILTSSEPGALLPTVRSRSVTFRAAPLSTEEMRAFLADERVADALSEDTMPGTEQERLAFAAGAPARLLAGPALTAARRNAGRILDASQGRHRDAFEAAWTQANYGARGSFADTLDALTEALHERARVAVQSGDHLDALAAARCIEVVEAAKEQIAHNVSPQLLTARLVRDLQEVFA